MNFRNAFITALRALSRNKMRSSLTSVGIIIGVSSVIVMIGIGSSARIAVRNRVESFGSNAMKIQTTHGITSKDLRQMKQFYPTVKYISPVLHWRNSLSLFEGNHHRTWVMGVNLDYFKIQNRKIKKGRFFTPEEVYASAKYAVIGSTIVKKLLGGADPIGKDIIAEDVPLRIIGVMEDQGEAFNGQDFDDLICMPYTTANLRISNKRTFMQFYVSAYSDSQVDKTAQDVAQYISTKYAHLQGKENSFRIYKSKDKLKIADDISNALAFLLAGIASISLFVGGVGIMNIMLVSVTERTREIGIRMAIGAKKNDIMTQFLIESVTLSSVGGIIGIILGLTIYALIIFILHIYGQKWPFLFSFSSIIVSVMFAAGVGIFFGYYPSKKAANLKPIDALKYE